MSTTPEVNQIDTPDKVRLIWGIPKDSTGCQKCLNAFLTVPDTQIICPACAQSDLAIQPVISREESPETILPFTVEGRFISEKLTAFVKNVKFASKDFNFENLKNRMIKLYWPLWLVDCRIKGSWQYEAGFNYQVKSSKEFYSGGSWNSQDVFHDRIRWEARAGNIDRKYANIPVPAIAQHGLFWKFLNGYSIKKAEPYNPEQLKDAVVFLPNLSPLDVHDEATMALTKAAEGDCKIAAASDHGRNYSLDADYDQFNWTQMLLPVLCTYYQDDTGKIHPIYINGQNGTICGNRVASTSKGLTVAGIIAAVALFAFILGVVINLLGAAIPPLIVIGTILIIVGVLGGLGALVPALWPYHWNRQQNQYNVFLMDHTSCSNR